MLVAKVLQKASLRAGFLLFVNRVFVDCKVKQIKLRRRRQFVLSV